MKIMVQWMKGSCVLWLAATYLLPGNSLAATTNGLAAALQRGLFEEEGNRNLAEAINAYQAALTLFEQDRKLAATAMFRLAECYRKQGNTNEALKQYQAVLRQFPEETALAGPSRQQLLAMGTSGTAEAGEILMPAMSKEESEEISRIRTLISNSPDLINALDPQTGLTPLHQAAYRGQVQVAQYLLASGADVNSKERIPGFKSKGQTPLHAAADNGHRAVVELLLSRKADVNARDNNGDTPLHLAAGRGFRTVADVLAASGAQIDGRDNGDETPLHWAAAAGFRPMVEWLLDHKADINARNGSEATPLLQAVAEKREEVVSFLLERGADPNLPGTRSIGGNMRYGIYPVHAALIAESTSILKLLLEHKANPNVEQKGDDLTPLFYAINRVPAMEALLKAGADPNRKNKNGKTPLMLAIEADAPEAAKQLLQANADPNLKDAQGMPPLVYAASRRSKPIVEQLIDAKADVNAPDAKGNTALYYATFMNMPELVELLLTHNANPNASGSARPPLSLAQEQLSRFPASAAEYPRYQTIARLLREHGAIEDLPKLDRIELRRPQTGFIESTFWKGTNGWNRFGLLELLAVHYGFVSANPKPMEYQTVNRASNVRDGALPFPDLVHVTILKVGSDRRRGAPKTVDVTGILNGDPDVELEWGDAVVLPELDHPVATPWPGFTEQERTQLVARLTRTVHLKVKGESTNIVLRPNVNPRTAVPAVPGQSLQIPQFTLLPMLMQSGMLRVSSDLKHVRVTRGFSPRDPIFPSFIDCSNQNEPPDLWLREGDSFELREKE